MNLRRRLAAAAALIVVLLAVGGFVILRTSESAQMAQVDRQLRTALPNAFAIAAPNGPPPVVRDQPGDVFSDVYVARVERDGSRTTVVPHGSEAIPQLPTTTSERDAPQIVTVASATGSVRWRALLVGDGRTGPQLLVAVPLDRVDAAQHRLEIAVLVVVGAALAGLAISGWWVLRLGLRPIAEVTEAADAIANGDRDRRLRVPARRTEAAHLARAFNVMLDEHEANEARLRRFISDVSHELRTPVASIRGFADVYRQGGLPDEAAVRDAMRRIGGESARMAELVEDLLLLARLDEGRPLQRGVVDLAAVLHDAALDASVTHPSRSVRVDVREDVRAVGDEARIRQVVANLVHNALAHGGAAANVSLHAQVQGDVCVLEVADDGVGMRPDEAAQAFERFWRADASRVRSSGGSGLGLAIVRAIVEAHGGRVVLDSTPGAGTRVRLVLPAAGDRATDRASAGAAAATGIARPALRP